jgi:hypothetical protein
MLYSINPLSNSLDTAKEMFHDDLKKSQYSLEEKIKRARSSDVLMINKGKWRERCNRGIEFKIFVL